MEDEEKERKRGEREAECSFYNQPPLHLWGFVAAAFAFCLLLFGFCSSSSRTRAGLDTCCAVVDNGAPSRLLRGRDYVRPLLACPSVPW